jgi:hypothetical protein
MLHKSCNVYVISKNVYIWKKNIMATVGIVFVLVLILIYLGIIIITIAGIWKVFEKAGKPGWAAIIPIYNTIVMAEICGKPTWWGVLPIIPLAGIVFSIWLVNLTIKSFGKDEGYTIGTIFLPFVFWPILGFSKNIQYQGPFCGPQNNNANYMNQQINNIGNQNYQNNPNQGNQYNPNNPYNQGNQNNPNV